MQQCNSPAKLTAFEGVVCSYKRAMIRFAALACCTRSPSFDGEQAQNTTLAEQFRDQDHSSPSARIHELACRIVPALSGGAGNIAAAIGTAREQAAPSCVRMCKGGGHTYNLQLCLSSFTNPGV